MLNKSLFTVIAISAAPLLAAGTALAQEATPDTWMQASVSTKSRAEVQADLVAARQRGLIKSWSAGCFEPVRSQRARADVKAATLRAVDSGEIKAINAEVYSFVPAVPLHIAQASR